MPTYLQILERTADRLGLNRDTLFTNDFRQLRTFHSARLETCWQQYWWPSLMHCEQRIFRAEWAAGTYHELDEVFHRASGKYYQALTTTTAEPETSGVVSDYWVECGAINAGQTWDATWTYSITEQVEYGGTIYQAFAVPPVGTAPTNATYWGEVLNFDRYVATTQSWETNTIGMVKDVWVYNPRTTTRNRAVEYHLSERGLQISDNLTSVWIEFQDPSFELTGDVWSSTATYTAGQQAYSSTNGDMYEALTSTTDAPESSVNWVRRVIPDEFATALQLGACADWHRSRMNVELSAWFEKAFEDELLGAVAIYTAMQGQMRKTVVRR